MVALLEPTLELEAACVSEPFYIGETSARVCHAKREMGKSKGDVNLCIGVLVWWCHSIKAASKCNVKYMGSLLATQSPHIQENLYII